MQEEIVFPNTGSLTNIPLDDYASDFSVDDFLEEDYIHEDPEPLPINKPVLNNVSDEQLLAINHIIAGDNVVVDSVSGSGKSTTILSCAKMLPLKRFLQITYNASLRKDVLQKVDSLELTNIEVHTFHSLAVKYYLSTAHTDTGIRKIMYDHMKPREPLPFYDIIVLDEAQDMTFLYYQFIMKYAFDMNYPFQIFILGDYMQALYQFKGSDERFLTFADKIWYNLPLLKTKTFHMCNLKTSYRITNQMADFVNHAMLGESRLIACKEGDPVVYIRNSRRNLEKIVISQINLLLEAGESPNSIFVLGASVKGINSNIRKMENFLVEKNIPCYVPMFETEKIDEKVIEGKVVFSTFHSVKGRERPYVFIMGFDQTYFDFYASNLSYDVCPNTLYVGCTRATHKLFLLESDQYTTDRPLQFLKLNHYQMREKSYIHFKGIPRSVFYVQNKETLSTLSEPAKIEYHDITPTDLIKFVPEVVIEEISPLLDRIFITEKELKPENEIAIPNMIKTSRGLYEDVSDLNGIAIPSIYYDHIQKVFDPDSPNIGANILLSIIHNTMEETKDYEYSFLKEIIAMLPDDCTTPGEYLFLSNVFVATREKLYFKLKQIDDADYTWLSDELISACMQRLDETIGNECQNGNPPLIEHSIINATMDNEIERINLILKPFFPDHKKKFRFHARTDLITDECIWELKCTSTISIEHMLQVVIYQWIWLIVNNPSLGVAAIKKTKIVTKPLRLFNIKTGEILRLNASFDELTTIVVALLRGKYADIPVKSDEDFIKDAVAFTETMVAKYGFGSN